MSSRVALFLETLILIVLPLTLLQFHPALFQYRILVMALSLIYVIFISLKAKISLTQMGFTRPKPSLLKAVIPVLLVSFFVAYFLPLHLSNILFDSTIFSKIFFIPIYLFISVPLQELIFRGFYISRLELVSKNRTFLILHSSIIFALIHLPFHSLPILIGTFFLGVYLAYLFLQQRNIWILMLIHAFMIYFVLLSK